MNGITSYPKRLPLAGLFAALLLAPLAAYPQDEAAIRNPDLVLAKFVSLYAWGSQPIEAFSPKDVQDRKLDTICDFFILSGTPVDPAARQDAASRIADFVRLLVDEKTRTEGERKGEFDKLAREAAKRICSELQAESPDSDGKYFALKAKIFESDRNKAPKPKAGVPDPAAIVAASSIMTKDLVNPSGASQGELAKAVPGTDYTPAAGPTETHADKALVTQAILPLLNANYGYLPYSSSMYTIFTSQPGSFVPSLTGQSFKISRILMSPAGSTEGSDSLLMSVLPEFHLTTEGYSVAGSLTATAANGGTNFLDLSSWPQMNLNFLFSQFLSRERDGRRVVYAITTIEPSIGFEEDSYLATAASPVRKTRLATPALRVTRSSLREKPLIAPYDIFFNYDISFGIARANSYQTLPAVQQVVIAPGSVQPNPKPGGAPLNFSNLTNSTSTKMGVPQSYYAFPLSLQLPLKAVISKGSDDAVLEPYATVTPALERIPTNALGTSFLWITYTDKNGVRTSKYFGVWVERQNTWTEGKIAWKGGVQATFGLGGN